MSAPTPAASVDPSRTTKLIVCFAIIYLVWGSSYLAMKIGVRHLDPFAFTGLRFVLAGLLLAAFAMMRGARLPQGLTEWRHVVVMGLCACTISAGINNYVIQWVPSNQSALINATSALWIASLGTLGPKGHSLATRARIGLVIGFIGVAILVWPHGGLSTEALGSKLAIVLACLVWALSTLYYRTTLPKTDPLLFTGLQMLSGGVVLCAFGGFTAGFTSSDWNWQGVVAMLYLTIFGSCIAYSAFTWLMMNTTPDKLGTYSYVNPAVAALLGWLFLHETLTGAQLLAMLIILVGVGLVTWRPRSPL